MKQSYNSLSIRSPPKLIVTFLREVSRSLSCIIEITFEAKKEAHPIELLAVTNSSISFLIFSSLFESDDHKLGTFEDRTSEAARIPLLLEPVIKTITVFEIAP